MVLLIDFSSFSRIPSRLRALIATLSEGLLTFNILANSLSAGKFLPWGI